MGNVLVYSEVRAGRVQPVTLELISAARVIAEATGGNVETLALGENPTALVPALHASDRVLLVRHAALGHYIPEAHLAAISEVVRVRRPAAVLFAYSSFGLDLAPGLAALSRLPLVAYVTHLRACSAAIEAESQIYAGKVRATTHAPLPAVLALMPGAFKEAEADRGAPDVLELAAPAALDSLRTAFVSESAPVPGASDLALAEKIVCVGRGIKEKDRIELARDLAATLGAELAGSRPVVDSGWLPKERQVGKSGTKVKPKLYVAVGVSGAPEHIEGMSGADFIVAVNSDAKAPIFGVAHYGTTCDLLDLLPALTERLRG
jgi:electron transfer flavoprotein alpha subunit